MNIAFVSSEAFPFAKVGGLGDITGALPKALDKLGHKVKVFIPKYSLINFNNHKLEYVAEVGEMPIRVNGKSYVTRLFKSYLPGSFVDIYFVDCPHFFHRKDHTGNDVIYTNHQDEDERYVLFSKAVIEAIQRMKWLPDIINCNDWQTGLLPLLLRDNYSWDRFLDPVATAFSIHNIGYQGRFPKSLMLKAEIRAELFYPNSPIEIMGTVCFMKAGLMYSDVINTVSPTYAAEIMTSDYGEGLEGVLSYRVNDFYGILNGIDTEVWNPETDKMIPVNYNINSLEGKYENKKHLLNSMNLPHYKNTPVIGMISRMVGQKGFDIFAESVYDLMRLPVQWVILGSGEDRYENLFRSLQQMFPDRIATWFGKNEQLAHLIEAGSDMFLMPSLYEPCGLNQMYSLIYGTVPIVRKTGGLADTVKDWDEYSYRGDFSGNGFSFYDYSAFALFKSVERAVNAFYNHDVWIQIVKNGMISDFSWENSAQTYLKMYESAINKRRG
ncbi:MAG: glycogen synthase [Ignavibacteriaceae bacterium]|nr:glycogen synthase [Ignavibacteriaceae bacterium]